MPRHDCPYCGGELDAATSASGESISPEPGDVSVCLYCARVLRFDDDLKPRKLVLPDEDYIMSDPFVKRTVSSIKKMLRGRVGHDK